MNTTRERLVLLLVCCCLRSLILGSPSSQLLASQSLSSAKPTALLTSSAPTTPFSSPLPSRRPTLLPKTPLPTKKKQPTVQPTSQLPILLADGNVLCEFYRTVRNKSALHDWRCDPPLLFSVSNWSYVTIESDTTQSFFGCVTSLVIENVNLGGATLPASFRNLTGLQTLIIVNSKLSGSLPAHFSLELISLSLADNNISGTIPTGIGALIRLDSLNLGSNKLIGSIPTEIGALTDLYTLLDLGYNRLSGSLPTEIGKLAQLQWLNLVGNRLSGTIPQEFGQMGYLQNVFMQKNLFSGRLPSLSNFTLLKQFMITNNRFSGSLPSSLGGLLGLSVLDVGYNEFSGSFLDLTNLTYLVEVYASHNRFSGSIGSWIGNLKQLKVLVLQKNYLSSSLPMEIGNATSLQTLALGQNFFTSLVPRSLSCLQNLTTLTINGNMFENDGLDFISAAKQPHLQCIDVSQNNFTGQINPDIFTLLKDLQTFSAGANCFTMKSLPVEICSAKSLKALFFDGMTSGDGCKQFYWGAGLRKKPFEFLGTYSKLTIDSPLPACILSLPNLTSLHLSGLGLPGSIPNVAFSPSLVDLSLSYNALTGVLPDSLQTNMSSFESVDLSYNKISGSFLGEVCRTGCSYKIDGCTPDSPARKLDNVCFVELNLDVNRFSGKLPQTSYNWENISLLEGNMFSCDARRDGTDIPINDPFYDNFSCGSNFFIAMFLAWFFTLLIGIILVVTRERKEEERLKDLENKIMEESGGERKVGGAGNYLTLKEFGKFLLEFVETYWHKENTIDLHIKFCGMQLPIHPLVLVVFASVAQVDTVKMEEYLSSSRGALPTAGMAGDRQTVRITFDPSKASAGHDSITIRHSESSPASPSHGSITVRHSKSFPASLRCSSAGNFTDLGAAESEAPAPESETYEIPIVVSKMLECMNELHALTVIVLSLSLGLMITYGVAAPFTCMLKKTYAWVLTVAYRTGMPCAVILFFLWSASIASVNALIMLQKKNRRLTFGELDETSSVEKGSDNRPGGQGDGKEEEKQNMAFGVEWSDMYMTIFLFMRVAMITIVNFAVVFTVNASYVFIVIQYHRNIQNAAKFSLVVFMLSWNKLIIPSMLHNKSPLNCVCRLGMAHSQIKAFMDKWLNGLTFDVVLLTINIVLVPIFATLCTSKTCFLGTFRPEAPLVSTYHFTYESNGHTLPWTSSTTFTPSFSYSYTCSSLLTTLYSPIYIGVAMWTTFAVPVLRHLAARVSTKRKLGLRRFFVQSLSDFVLLLTNGMVCPLAGLAIGVGIITRTIIMQYHIVSFAIDDANYKKKSSGGAGGAHGDGNKDFEGSEDSKGSKMVALFWGEEWLVAGLRAVVDCFSRNPNPNRCYSLSCCDCFSPPKAKGSEAGATESKSAAARIEEFVKECRSQVPVNPIYMARWVLYIFPPLLLAFFEFDIVGDSRGDTAAAWAPVVMIFIPWLVIALHEATEKGVWAALWQRRAPAPDSPPQEQPGQDGGITTDPNPNLTLTLTLTDGVTIQENPMISLSRLSVIAATHERRPQLNSLGAYPRLGSGGAYPRMSLEMQSTSQLDQSRDSMVNENLGF